MSDSAVMCEELEQLLLALMIEEGIISQGIQVSVKDKEKDSPKEKSLHQEAAMLTP